jgi:L-histidine Nalpha-methyltransferase
MRPSVLSAADVDRLDPARAAFAADVRTGLVATQKRLPPRWFYDALGSSLFESICRLPWYGITRAESALLAAHARDVAAALGDAASIIELGGGSGEKLSLLLDALDERKYATRVHLVDVSARALELASANLSRFADITVVPIEATYEEGLSEAVRVPAAGRQLAVFLGSNIGNSEPDEARALIDGIAASLRPGDLFLLGADLVKPEADLILAYDDPLGVTAAFNRNLLQRMNTELGADFELATFAHQARWNADAGRVEMHLVSRLRQTVHIPGAGLRVSFVPGESIWTESSHKYDPASVQALGAAAGFRTRAQWIEPRVRFALTLFER